MKKNQISLLLCVGLLACALGARAEDSGLRLGAGANYWTAVKSLDADNVDKHGFSWVGTVQYWPSWIGVEADVEWFKSGYAGAVQDVWAPQGYLILGKTLYAAVGLGGYYSDGDWADKPFYAFRLGLDLEFFSRLHLDINANYRFQDWSSLNTSDIDSDTITLGVAARIAL
jgi:hypothetical protein